MMGERKVLETYLAVTIGLLTVVTFVVLAGLTRGQTSFVLAIILIIILIGVTILNAMIQLRILDAVQEQ